jgi:hypothetical protein
VCIAFGEEYSGFALRLLFVISSLRLEYSKDAIEKEEMKKDVQRFVLSKQSRRVGGGPPTLLIRQNKLNDNNTNKKEEKTNRCHLGEGKKVES